MLEKIKQWLKSLGFEVTEEQLKTLEIVEEKKPEDKKEEKKQEDKKVEDKKPDEGKGGEDKDKALLDRLAALEAKLQEKEENEAKASRVAKIKSLAGETVDIDYLTALLKDTEEKDLKAGIDKVKSEKPYLFKSTDTKGFNPAGEVDVLTGVEKAFFDRNPDLKSKE